ISWTAVHFYVAACYGFVFYRQRDRREYLAFSLLTIAFGLYTAGAVIVLRAIEPSAAAQGTELQLLATGLSVPTFVAFGTRIMMRSSRMWTRGGYIFGAFAVIVALSGLGVDPNAAQLSSTNATPLEPLGLVVFSAIPT